MELSIKKKYLKLFTVVKIWNYGGMKVFNPEILNGNVDRINKALVD